MRLHAINDFRLEEVEKPQPRGKEILIKVGACGICGSDIPRVYELGTKVYPVTLGHEYAGTVVAVGEDADPNLIGKVGAVYPVVPCGQCDSCQIGQELMVDLQNIACFHPIGIWLFPIILRQQWKNYQLLNLQL